MSITDAVRKHKGKTVLIADPDYSTIKYAVDVLHDAGASVISTNNGIDAVKTVYEENVDIAFISLQLRLQGGYDSIKEIKNINNNKSKVIMIALSNGHELEERVRCKVIGCKDYLHKPVLPIQFLEMMDKYFK